MWMSGDLKAVVKEVRVKFLGSEAGYGGVRPCPVGSHAWASMAAAPGNGG